MKTLLKKYIFLIVALWVVQTIIPGFSITGGLISYLLIALSLALVNTFIKPLLKIIFLPINMMTLGLFTVVINAFLLYATALFFPEMSFASWTLNSTNISGVQVPTIEFGIIATYVVTALTLSLVSTFLYKL